MALDPPRSLILVVEDDAGVALLQRRRLERADFRVHVAGNIDDAMVRLAEGGVALVLMDYRLGATTGFDLHRRMKAAGFDVPVIVVSGSMDDAMVIEAMRAGVRDVVPKSADYLDYLPDAVRGVLRQVAAVPERSVPDSPRTTVLIVEDDTGLAELEKRELERAGYCVMLATTREAALSAVRNSHVNLAIIDLRLHDQNSGLDLYEQIKADRADVPAILVTAFPDQAVAIRALRAGVRDFIPKTGRFLEQLPGAVDRVVAQVRIEKKLVDSELRLASIIGTTMDAIVMCDEKSRIVLFNHSAEEMFGCPAAEALGQPLDRFIPELRLRDNSNGSGGAPRGLMRQRLEVDAIRSAGERMPIEVSVSDVVIHDKHLFTVIARDVSERRRIEAELREADRRKDEFLGMLAHELRNPLAAIMTAGEVLHRKGADPSIQKLTSVVRRQSKALSRMVDDLLDVSRVTLGKIQIADEPLLLSEVATRTAEAMREVVRHSGLQLDVHIERDPVWLRGDATRLEQVLTNLLNNAVKFTPPGGRIALSARRDGHDAVLSVRDSGIGMDRSLLPKVFDLFVQGETSLDRAKSGLGIGLALVRQVVSLHGGRVSAYSDGIGRGSEFVVRLPAMREEPLPAREETPSTDILVKPMRVLVVDDQQDIADAVALLVRMLGHDATAVYDGPAALAVTASAPPDVMLVDIGMPGMTGYDVAVRVREKPEWARVRLVALTGYGREEDRMTALGAGFDLHVTKPLTDARLRDVLGVVTRSA